MRLLIWGIVMLAFLAGCSETRGPMHYQIPKVGKVEIDGKFDDWHDRGLQVKLFADRFGKLAPASDISAKFTLGWNEEGFIR